jgi:ABC-type transport system involved in multi-copper enzyme maturation permease subunit
VRLVRAELLKARRRTATYVVLLVDLVLMALTFLAVSQGMNLLDVVEFPAMYTIIGQFAFGLGGLLAVVYAAAFVGADWNWGVIRNVIARGESRANYLLAKGVALAILLAIATVIVFAVGIVMVYIAAAIAGVPVASPLRGRGLQDLAENILLGYPVLLQRAAIGFAVAVVLRSQLAGAVVGIVLFLGEAVITQILTLLSLSSSITDGGGFQNGFQPIGPEWYQYLPISLGGNVLDALPGAGSSLGGGSGTGGFEGLLLRPVPFEIAFPLVFVYLAIAVLIGVLALQRQEIT